MSQQFAGLKDVGLVFVLAIAIAACGSSGGQSGSGSSTSSVTGAGNTDPTSNTLQLVSTSLGKLVADSEGKVLYLYVPDGTATVSAVPAGVLEVWPPVLADGVPTLGPGLTAKATTATQPDGQEWVSYNGHLLYGFTADTKPGDVVGNGVGSVWYAVTAAGEPVQS